MELLDLKLTSGGILIFLLITLAVLWIAERNRFFRLPPSSNSPVTFYQTLGAFLTYLVFAFIVLPIFLVLLALMSRGEVQGVKNLPELWFGWIQIGALWAIFFLLILYCFAIKADTRRYIFWGREEASSKRFWKGFGMGVVTWLVSYPFVLLISLVAKYIALKIWGVAETEQVAVKHLKMTMSEPVLFAAMIFVIVIIVPFMEELLFRGFFQNYVKRYLGRAWAIVLTAILFSLAHFASSQGAGNFQLLLSLFALALFLSFIYERQGTLWASFGLHVAFNAWNVLMIILALDV